MLGWLCLTFALAFATAVIPFASIELFLIGLVSQHPGIPWLALGAAAAVGQVAGKTVHYLAARGAARQPRSGRFRTLVDRARHNPRWLVGVVGGSALCGLPPFGAITLVAGATQMRVTLFLATALPGRLVRHSAIAAGAGSLL